MKKRGKILRDTNAGPGLLMAEGQQYTFTLEGMWHSNEAPRVGMIADVEFNDRGEIISVSAVPESQLAREQAEAAVSVARERGAALASGAVAKFGVPSLVGAAALIVGWWMLPAISVNAFGSSVHITFWQVLGVVNSGTSAMASMFAGRGAGSTGIYGLFAVIALVGPFVHHFWSDRRAVLGGLLPLLFMLFVGYGVMHALSSMGSSVGGRFANEMVNQALDAVSVGSGIYLSLIASIYFAFVSARRFLASRAGAEQGYGKPKATI